MRKNCQEYIILNKITMKLICSSKKNNEINLLESSILYRDLISYFISLVHIMCMVQYHQYTPNIYRWNEI